MTSLLYPQRQQQLKRLVQKFGLADESRIRWDLLDLALVHPTASPTQNYEQLEFVGDAVVRISLGEFLYATYPEAPVGEFAALRSVLGSDRVLAQIAASYGLERYLVVGNSALGDKTGEETRLAEALEAVLGALYLSTHTLELIQPWLNSHWLELATEIRKDPARQNYKAALQEWTQGHYKTLPEYRVTEVGQIGDPQRFRAEVWLQEQQLGSGTGRSIKAAEQAAAQMAFQSLPSLPTSAIDPAT